MKNSLIIILITFCFISVFGQQKPSVQKLLDNQLIKKHEVENFNKVLAAQEGLSKAAYITALLKMEFKNIFGFDYNRFGSFVQFGESPKDEFAKKNLNSTIIAYLWKMNRAGLLTERQFNIQKERINSSKYISYIQLLMELSVQANYEEGLRPEKIIEYGKLMVEQGIMLKTSFDRLKTDALQSRIFSHNQLINYFERSKLFDLSKYSDDPAIYLEQIHREVAMLIPEALNFTDFSYSIEVDSTESYKDYIAHRVVVSLKNRGKLYRHKSFISINNKKNKNQFLGTIDSGNFYQIFNKILTDQNAPVRLHTTLSNAQYDQIEKFQYFGIVALDSLQAEAFRPLSFIEISNENFESLSSEKIEQSIKEYEKLGLLSHLNSNQISSAKEEVYKNDCRNLTDVLMHFPGVVYWFDAEFANLNHPYEELLKEYAKISRGAFNPTEISDDFELDKSSFVTVKFRLGDKKYVKKFKIESDWVDPDFFTYIKKITSENGLKGQFYELSTGGQEVSVIFLTPEQFEYLQTNKLLDFSGEINL